MMHTMTFPRALVAIATLVAGVDAAAAQSALVTNIFTGGDRGAYHVAFCPTLAEKMREAGANARCVPSQGTRENLERVLTNPTQFGYGQLDVYALEGGLLSARRAFQVVRQDDARECLFAVSKNSSITSFGALAASARNLKFILPPKESGSAGTFQFLKSVDDEGLAHARTVTNAAGTDEAIREALASDDGIAFFVQFPDAENERFKLIRSLGGHLVPIIDRDILRQEVEGRRIYFGEATEIEDAAAEGGKLTTACTPMVVFTGDSDRIADPEARRSHDALASAVKLLRHEDLMPREPAFARLFRRTREISQPALDRLMRTSELARARAKPLLDWIIERAAPRM